MAFTEQPRNAALEAIKAEAKYYAAFKQEAAKEVVKQVSLEELEVTAHGYNNGDVIVITELNGGEGLILTTGNTVQSYFVKEKTANTFKLALKEGGPTVTWTTAITATKAKVARVVEVSGGSPAYAREATSFGAVSLGKMEDTSGKKLNIPEGVTLMFVATMVKPKVEAGDYLVQLAPVNGTTGELYGKQGTWTITSDAFSAG